MSASFTIKVNAIRTGAVGELTNVVKNVEFTVKGVDQGQTFNLPQTVELADPQAEIFVQLQDVTEANVIQWITENFENLDSVKAHIQYVLDQEIAKAVFTSQPLPWAPAPETPTPQPE